MVPAGNKAKPFVGQPYHKNSSSSSSSWLAYQQGKIFEKFKENAKPIGMVRQLNYSKSTITFKINIVKLINKHPKVKNSSLSLILF